jgi:hypothetical protein
MTYSVFSTRSGDSKTVSKSVRHGPAGEDPERKAGQRKSENRPGNPGDLVFCGSCEADSVTPMGSEQPSKITGKTACLPKRCAKTDAISAPATEIADPDLLLLTRAWSCLPPAIRAAIITLARHTLPPSPLPVAMVPFQTRKVASAHRRITPERSTPKRR